MLIIINFKYQKKEIIERKKISSYLFDILLNKYD